MRSGQTATARRPASSASTSARRLRVDARSRGSPKSGRCEPGKPPTKPFVPTMPTSMPVDAAIGAGALQHVMPASASTADDLVLAPACQSWLPSTANDRGVRRRGGVGEHRASSGSPCAVRSPASRTRSALPAISAKAASISSRRTRGSGCRPLRRRAPSCGRCARWPWSAQSYPAHGSYPDDQTVGNAGDRGTATACRQRPPFEDIETSLKRCRVRAEGGGGPVHAGWQPGVLGPRRARSRRNDLDLFVKPEDAERALEVLVAAGMRAGAPAGGLAAEGLGRRGARRPDLRAAQPRHRRHAVGAGRAHERVLDRHAGDARSKTCSPRS